MSQSPRAKRIAQTLRDVLAEMIDREVKDPRVKAAGFVGVNHVELNRDGSVARVYVSFYGAEGGDQATASERAMQGLAASAGYLRGHVTRRARLKRAPEIRFVHDESPEFRERLAELQGPAPGDDDVG